MQPNIAFPPSREKAAPLRVAVIEDDRIMRILLEKLIAKQADLDLCGAWGSGEEALAALHALRPDVVVVDLELPGISGEDCITTARKLLLRGPGRVGYGRGAGTGCEGV